MHLMARLPRRLFPAIIQVMSSHMALLPYRFPVLEETVKEWNQKGMPPTDSPAFRTSQY